MHLAPLPDQSLLLRLVQVLSCTKVLDLELVSVLGIRVQDIVTMV